MKNGTKILIIVISVLIVISFIFVGKYNNLVTLEENINGKYSQIDVQLQRRSDLIPNLVNTVKGYTKHEEKVIDNITKARANLAGAKGVKEAAKANSELTEALSKLLVVVENYPDLKADKTFINLQDELSGTENRISVARKDYNDSVKEFNSTIKRFPNNIIGKMLGFSSKDYFEASEQSKEVPNVTFE